MKVDTKMHDELIPMSDRLPSKMLSLGRLMKSPSISPTLNMKDKFHGSVFYSSQLMSSGESPNEDHHLEEDQLEESHHNHAMYHQRSLKGVGAGLAQLNSALPSPPSSTASSMDQDGPVLDMYNGSDFGGFDQDIVLEEIKSCDEQSLISEVSKCLDSLLTKVTEEVLEQEIWDKVEIDFEGETVMPNGLRLSRGVAVMEYERDVEPRFTNQLSYLKNILQKNLLRYKSAKPFLSPVDSVTLKIPRYYQIIHHPMDLSTIKHRLNFLWYQNASECIADLRLILENCFKFNSPQEFVYKAGKNFEKYLEEKLADMPETEVVIPCPEKPDPKEYFKEKNQMFKRIDPILQENVAAFGSPVAPIEAVSTPINTSVPGKMTTRSVRGLKLKKPTKELVTFTESNPSPDVRQRTYKKVKLNEAMKWCLDLWKQLSHKEHADVAWPFYQPVDLNIYTDYLEKIKTPMDMSTIRMKLETGQYNTVDQFAKDFRLMFTNCLRYNQNNASRAALVDQCNSFQFLFETRFAMIPDHYKQMRMDSSNSRNVSPCSDRSAKKQVQKPILQSSSSFDASSSRKRKAKEIFTFDTPTSSSRPLKKSKKEPKTPVPQFDLVDITRIQQQINTLTNVFEAALKGNVSRGELKKISAQLAKLKKGQSPVFEETPKYKGSSTGRRGRPPKHMTKAQSLSSSESDSDSDSDSSSDDEEEFDPRNTEHLTRLKSQLEELPLEDLRKLVEILRECEPGLVTSQSNVELDFEVLKQPTIIKLKKFVDSSRLNRQAAKPSPKYPSSMSSKHPKPTNNNFLNNNDCDNLSRAPSRASNLNLSDVSSSDSEED